MRTRAALATAFVLAARRRRAAAQAAPIPPGAKWSQATIPSSGGVNLHADILRPANLPANAKTPVILSIGPYFNHSGQVGPAGPVEDASYDPVGPTVGPSDRFDDFVRGAKLMQKGYTFVMVDLRGFGGSSGCLDWGGPGEQSDVVSSVQWLASQSWSNGRVGMYGKSYDGVTGLVGREQAPLGPEGRGRAGAGLRPLPLPLRRRHPAAELDRHARALQPDQPHARPRARQPDLLDQRRGRPHPPRLQRAEPARPDGRRQPQLALLAAAQPDPGRQGLEGAAVPHPGHDREQHGGRRPGPVHAQPRGLPALVAGPVGARARQRDVQGERHLDRL